MIIKQIILLAKLVSTQVVWILLKREKELMHDNLVYYVLVLTNVISNGLEQLLLLLYVLFFRLDYR